MSRWRFAARVPGLACGLALAVRPAGLAEVFGAQGRVLKIVSVKRLRNDLRVPLTLHGPARTMVGVPVRWLKVRVLLISDKGLGISRLGRPRPFDRRSNRMRRTGASVDAILSMASAKDAAVGHHTGAKARISRWSVTQLVTHHNETGHIRNRIWPLSWSGWPDLNRWPLRPEANACCGLPPLIFRLTWCARDRQSRLRSGFIAVGN
jgi:hypothetical protein